VVRQINDYFNEKSGLLQVSVRKTYERFLKIRGTPREIALGFALGLFVGMSPTMGFQMAIAVFLAALFKWNKLSAVASVWVTNPVTAPVIYGLTYFIGAQILGIKGISLTPETMSVSSFLVLFKKTPVILWAMTLGGVVVGIPLAVTGYVVINKVVDTYQREIRQKLSDKKQAMAENRRRRKSAKKRKKKARRSG